MKRLIFLSSLVLCTAIAGYAQDDIYYNSSDIEKEKKEEKRRAREEAEQRAYDEQNYDYRASGNSYDDKGDYRTYNNSYESDGNAYDDYDNDYYYASNIRRFNYPFYGMGYYNSFYNPYWYDPFWYDPYWGWSAWNRPGFSIGFGGGPYWNSYWSWYSWYGYPMYNSYYNYPYYGNAYCNNYYSGYWNGYYSGLYNNNGYRQTYGPRNSYTSSVIHNNGVRGLRSGVRPAPGGINTPVNGQRNSGIRPSNERQQVTNRRFFETDRNMPAVTPSNNIRTGNDDPRGGRPGISERNVRQERNYSPQPAVRQERQLQQPRYERPSNSFQRSEPAFQRSEPVRSSPSFSAPSRSSGGGNFGGGSRGGSFGGGAPRGGGRR